jgi:hypothetical protein
MCLRIHAIILALNEEIFIENQLKTLYPFCSGISVLTQYDRDWYGKPISPDRTLQMVASFPDPEGKLHLVVRRWPDEAAARNSEMLGLLSRPHRRIMSHGSSISRISTFHRPPDYFLIVDADEIYDPKTFPRILTYLAAKRPRGMRVNAFNYVRTWNRRVPREVVRFCHFGFLRPGIRFKMRRTVSWNETRLAKALMICHLPNFASRLCGYIECPPDVGVFHHGCWLGGRARLREKASKSSHQESDVLSYPAAVDACPYHIVQTSELPLSITEGSWPAEYFETPAGCLQ